MFLPGRAECLIKINFMFHQKKKQSEYFILTQDESDQDFPVIAAYPDDLDVIDFITGKTVKRIRFPVLMDLSEDSTDFRPDLFLTVFPLFSNRMKEILDLSGIQHIEYFPVVFSNTRSLEMETGYWIANILSVIECLDVRESLITVLSGRSRIAINGGFRINEARIHQDKIFRLAEDRNLIIVNEEIKSTLESCGLKGVEFINTKDYRPQVSQ